MGSRDQFGRVRRLGRSHLAVHAADSVNTRTIGGCVVDIGHHLMDDGARGLLVFATFVERGADALFVSTSALMISNRERASSYAAGHLLRARPSWPVANELWNQLYRCVASSRGLYRSYPRGEKPTDLSVQNPTKYEAMAANEAVEHDRHDVVSISRPWYGQPAIVVERGNDAIGPSWKADWSRRQAVGCKIVPTVRSRKCNRRSRGEELRLLPEVRALLIREATCSAPSRRFR
jgi:hypothetical protein